MNADEIIRQMMQDEVEDQPLIAPVAYGRLRGIAPQQVYYWIRTGKIGVVVCNCGRKCIRKEDADELLRRAGKLPPKNGEADSGSDTSASGGPAE